MPSMSPSRFPWITVSGVRSSWVTSARRLRRCSSLACRRADIELNACASVQTSGGPRSAIRSRSRVISEWSGEITLGGRPTGLGSSAATPARIAVVRSASNRRSQIPSCSHASCSREGRGTWAVRAGTPPAR